MITTIISQELFNKLVSACYPWLLYSFSYKNTDYDFLFCKRCAVYIQYISYEFGIQTKNTATIHCYLVKGSRTFNKLSQINEPTK